MTRKLIPLLVTGSFLALVGCSSVAATNAGSEVATVSTAAPTAIAGTAANLAVQQDAPRPNVMFILLDDLGYGQLGITGHDIIKTPNIDRLAKDGMLFANGYSGHGLQQSPAAGRGVAELIIHNAYRTLDLSEVGYERMVEGRPFLEKAVI